MKKYQRLQGKEWHKVKNSFRLLYTYKNDNGNIKGIYTNDKIKISHWLNNEEKINYLQCEKQKEVIDKVNKKLNNFIDCCKAEKLESGSDYIHHQYWDMFERFNKQIKDILKEVE